MVAFPSASEFKDWASGIQSAMVAIALVSGGIWTLFNFYLGRRATAERQLSEQAIVNINVDACQVRIEGDPSLYIAATATLTNVGSRNVALDFEADTTLQTESHLSERAPSSGWAELLIDHEEDEAPDEEPSPFKVSRIAFSDSGQSELLEGKSLGISATFDSSLTLLRGSTQQLPVLMKVHRPGLYLVDSPRTSIPISGKAIRPWRESHLTGDWYGQAPPLWLCRDPKAMLLLTVTTAGKPGSRSSTGRFARCA